MELIINLEAYTYLNEIQHIITHNNRTNYRSIEWRKWYST